MGFTDPCQNPEETPCYPCPTDEEPELHGELTLADLSQATLLVVS